MRQQSKDNNHTSILPTEQNKNKHARKYSKYSSNWLTGILSSLSLLTNSSQTSLAPHGRCFLIVIVIIFLTTTERLASQQASHFPIKNKYQCLTCITWPRSIPIFSYCYLLYCFQIKCFGLRWNSHSNLLPGSVVLCGHQVWKSVRVANFFLVYQGEPLALLDVNNIRVRQTYLYKKVGNYIKSLSIVIDETG